MWLIVEKTLVQNWQSFRWLTAFLIFLAYFVLDALYVKYTLAVVDKKPVRAANIGSSMYVLMAFGIFNYTHNFLYVVPVGLGSWFGTYFIIKREVYKNRDAN